LKSREEARRNKDIREEEIERRKERYRRGKKEIEKREERICAKISLQLLKSLHWHQHRSILGEA
jgi:hypothetical protein